MSSDHRVVVRSRKKKLARIRAIATQVLGRAEATLFVGDAEQEDDVSDEIDLRVAFANGGGTIQLRRLARGYELSIDSTVDGNRDSWEPLAEVVEAIAAALGTVIDDEDVALEMLAESDDEPRELASEVLLALEDRDGNVVQHGKIWLTRFFRHVLPDGTVLERPPPDEPLLTEDARYAARGVRLTALLHDSRGVPFRRHVWTLDGYGRIKGIEIEELAQGR